MPLARTEKLKRGERRDKMGLFLWTRKGESHGTLLTEFLLLDNCLMLAFFCKTVNSSLAGPTNHIKLCGVKPKSHVLLLLLDLRVDLNLQTGLIPV
jgi:hypothetical protein